MIAYNNIDWVAVYQNLQKSWKRWGMVVRFMERTGETVRTWGSMYKAVEKLVLFYGRKSWVVTGEILKVLEGFHHRAARRIMGMTAKRGAGGEWEYPMVVEAMETAGLYSIRVYNSGRHATIAERVAYHPIYELCTYAERMPGKSQFVQ